LPQQTYGISKTKIRQIAIQEIMKLDDKAKLIDKYITGKLEDTELWEFRVKLEQDAELAQEVALRKDIYNAISNKEKMELLQTLNSLETNSRTRRFRINIYSSKVQAIAASITVLMIIGAGFLSNYIGSNNTSNLNIYTEYFVDEGSLLATRSNAETSNALVKTGIKFYNNGKYQQAISLFESYPENIIARLYSGFSYMNLKKFDLAESQFKYILNQGDNIFIDQAEWNLGLSYLGDNQTEQATKIFTKIAEGNGAYSAQANNITKKLKNK